jgi:flagellar hook assembly protein FlgD
VRQQVDGGDASKEVASEVNYISLPGDRRLIDSIAFSRPIVTPNGDGIGDRLRLEFNLLKLLVPRPMRVAIHDLSGRQVRLLGDREATAGRVELEWDGKDSSGRLVAPGIYLVRIQVEGDVQTEIVSRPVAVAY